MTTKQKAQDKHKMSEIDENISKLFDIKKRLGKGAYGIVWKALDKRTNETLAVKKIFDAFRDETDAQRTFREIVFLKAFRNHPNVIKLHNVLKASNNLDIYLIFEYMESDLHNIIKKGSILKDIHKRYVMYQLINAIKYIHSGNVIHRDLKPSNVLIDSKCRCKLADFGLARSVSNRPLRDNNNLSDPIIEPLLTDYVATRWYRAPEILVASKRYTKGIDMWSLGCILGEMIRGKPIFQGSSTVNQIEKIVTALPEVTERDISAVGADFGSVLLSKQISRDRKTSLDELLCNAPEDALHLVKSLLVLDPLARLTAKQALAHPYVEKFRNSISEIELNVDILPPFRDDVRLTVPEYRSKLYEIVQAATDKANVQRNATGSYKNGSAIHRYKEHKIPSNIEKPELDSTKAQHSTKLKHTSSKERHLSKDRLLIRPEKHELETQQHMGMQQMLSKALKKMSPMSKRKTSHSKSIKPHAPEGVPEKVALQDERTQLLINRTKSHRTKPNNEMFEDSIRPYIYDKRNSIDCGYASLQDGAGGVSGGVGSLSKPPPTPNDLLRRTDSSAKLCKSSSSLHRDDHNTHHRPQQPQHSRIASEKEQTCVRSGHVEPHERLARSTPVVTTYDTNVNDNTYMRNSKSDMLSPERCSNATLKTNDRICYEQRLRKLEEEIEKYKKEVKSFCKESFRYKQQMASDDAGSFGTAHNTRNGAQALHKCKKPQPPLLPPVTPHSSTPKENPYYKLLSKGNREFGKQDYDLVTGGGSGDFLGHTHNTGGIVNVNSTGMEMLYLEQQQQLQQLKKQQHDYNNRHHQQQQQQQQQQQRLKPMSKFI